MSVTIYHNPSCATSRKVLGLIRDAGIEPDIILYLKTPPSKLELTELLKRLNLRPRDILRRRGTPYDELGLEDRGLSDSELVDAMVAHPILIERPIVITAEGAALCRPPERVLEILSQARAAPTQKKG
jgi:arsenate reductase